MRLYVAIHVGSVERYAPGTRRRRLYPIIKIRGSVAFGETSRKAFTVHLSFLPSFFVPPPRCFTSFFPLLVLFVHRATPDFSIVQEYRRPGAPGESCSPSRRERKRRYSSGEDRRFRQPLLFHFSFAFLLAKERGSIPPGANPLRARFPPRLFHSAASTKVCCPSRRVARRKTVSNVEITSVPTRASFRFEGNENPQRLLRLQWMMRCSCISPHLE